MYQVISNFNGGLDARKFFLSLPPGTLTTLLNGHITQGGEIEKRKAFLPTALPKGTFGAQETTQGIIVFGSRQVLNWTSETQIVTGDGVTGDVLISLDSAAEMPQVGDTITVAGSSVAAVNGNQTITGIIGSYISFPVNGVPVGTLTDSLAVALRFDPPVIYQALTHPLGGVNMTGANISTYFNGQPQVVTTWDNGDTLVYYDGTVVTDFYVGGYGSIEPSANSMAADLVTALNNTGLYTATLEPLSKLTIQVTGGTALVQMTVTAAVPGTAANSTVTQTTSAALSWGGATLTGGATGAAATGTLTAANNNVSNGETVTIGGTVYTFVTTLTGTANQVLIGATISASLANLAADINGAAGAGTLYNVGPVASAQVSAGAVTGGHTTVAALVTGAAGNSIATTASTTGNVLTWSAATLTGGGSGTAASGVLTVTGNVSNGDTVTIGGTVYTFVTTLTGTTHQVLINADPTGVGTLTNLVAAINGGSGAGASYDAGPVPSTQVSAALGGNQLTYLIYDFQRPITLNNSATGGTQSGSVFALINSPVFFRSDDTTTASDLAAAIAANNFGFQVSLAGSIVTVWPPGTDANGNALAVNGSDYLYPTTGGNLTVYVPPNGAVFEVFSIPTQSSATPYSVAVTTENATLDYQLVSNGVAATAPANAAGQFSITAGGNNPAATGTLTVSAIPNNNDTVTIGSTTYTFVKALTNAANEVLIAGTAAACLANLISAINGSAGAGTNYSSGTATNTQVSAGAISGNSTLITANIGGSGGSDPTRGNNIGTTVPVGTAFSFGATTLKGGGSAALNTIVSNGTNVANGDTVTINGKVYTFQTTLTNVDGHVQIASSAGSFPTVADATLFNLLLAVNLTGTAGTNYATATTRNASVTAINQDTTNHVLYLQANATGTAGNTLTLAKTSTNLTVGGATFSGGGSDPNQITQIQIGSTNLLSSYVAYNQSPNQTAADVVTAINANQGTSGFTATAQNNVVTVTAVNGGTGVNEAVLAVQCAGNVCIAACSINVTASSGSGISAVQVTDGNGTHNLMTNAGLIFEQTPGYGSETIAQYLARVAVNINLNTVNSGYLACSSGAQMWFSKATVTSADVGPNPGPNPVSGVAITSSLAITTAATTALAITTNTQTIPFTGRSGGTNNNTSANAPSSAVVTVSGGVAPYTYQWSAATSPAYALPQLSGTPNQWWIVGKNPGTTAVPAHLEPWVCTVTDSTGTSVTAPTFYLSLPQLGAAGKNF